MFVSVRIVYEFNLYCKLMPVVMQAENYFIADWFFLFNDLMNYKYKSRFKNLIVYKKTLRRSLAKVNEKAVKIFREFFCVYGINEITYYNNGFN